MTIRYLFVSFVSTKLKSHTFLQCEDRSVHLKSDHAKSYSLIQAALINICIYDNHYPSIFLILSLKNAVRL